MSDQSAKQPGASAKRRSRGEYEVGYGKPPKGGQFKKGEARKRGTRHQDDDNLMAVFKRYVSERVRIREGGRELVMTRGQAVVYVNNHRALNKDPQAMHNMYVLAEENGMFTDTTDIAQVRGGLLVPERAKSTEEYEETCRLMQIMVAEGEELTKLEDELEPGKYPHDVAGTRWITI